MTRRTGNPRNKGHQPLKTGQLIQGLNADQKRARDVTPDTVEETKSQARKPQKLAGVMIARILSPTADFGDALSERDDDLLWAAQFGSRLVLPVSGILHLEESRELSEAPFTTIEELERLAMNDSAAVVAERAERALAAAITERPSLNEEAYMGTPWLHLKPPETRDADSELRLVFSTNGLRDASLKRDRRVFREHGLLAGITGDGTTPHSFISLGSSHEPWPLQAAAQELTPTIAGNTITASKARVMVVL